MSLHIWPLGHALENVRGDPMKTKLGQVLTCKSPCVAHHHHWLLAINQHQCFKFQALLNNPGFASVQASHAQILTSISSRSTSRSTYHTHPTMDQHSHFQHGHHNIPHIFIQQVHMQPTTSSLFFLSSFSLLSLLGRQLALPNGLGGKLVWVI